MTESLQSLVKTYLNMTCLQLIKIWDPEDSNLFIYESYRFTTRGIKDYWLAVDSAIRYWDTAIGSKIASTRKFQKTKTVHTYKDRFHWRKLDKTKYPTPPPKKET